MRATVMAGVAAAALVGGALAGIAAVRLEARTQGQGTPPKGVAPARPNAAAVARGKYLVEAVGCTDCHTPMKMGPSGPEPMAGLFLSGHPASQPLPPPPAPVGPWVGAVSSTSTGFAGPWGVSYTANLTPDPETGLGQWTEQQFVDTIRTGRRQGRGREILPPMPWPVFKKFTDTDLKAMFAYLRTVPPVKNKVPDPVIAGAPK